MGAPVLSKPENRGTKVHQQIELFIRGDIEHPTKEMSGFADDFRRERDLYDQGILKAEERWGFDDALVPCEWVDRWLGMIPDQYWIDGLEAVITDFKTGKKYGNEVRYTQQGQLYMIGAFLRFPEIERVIVRFRYLDERKQYTKMYRREQMKAYLVPFLNRVDVMVNDRMMLPKASRMNCRFCDWGPNEGGTNACPWGVPWIR